MPLYTALLLITIIVPLALSFDKKVQFYRKFKFVLPSIAFVGMLYIVPDIYLTEIGVWGFNERYHSSIIILGLPLEELLFFIVIPYASLFIHYSFFAYFPEVKLSARAGKIVTILIILFSVLVIINHFDKIYTTYIMSSLLLVLMFSFLDKKRVINKFYVSFLIILVPFIIINGILTGSFIEDEVVWYNQAEIVGMRIFTIPIEDFAYSFSLILFNLLVIGVLSAKGMLNKE